jgi:hypothetical protein
MLDDRIEANNLGNWGLQTPFQDMGFAGAPEKCFLQRQAGPSAGCKKAGARPA